MNQKFIVVSFGIETGGHFGKGDTFVEAKKNCRFAGARHYDKFKAYRFFSQFPFAPAGREATKQEADCWVDEEGGVNWIRCEREEIWI